LTRHSFFIKHIKTIMEKMNDLKDLLKHEVEDLYSAEEQILSALPAMIEKASNTSLKNALTEHLRVTEEQKNRLDQVLQVLGQNKGEEEGPKKKKFLGLFGGGVQKCKGMEGIISEGKKIMGEDMDPDVMDAAIIASAQKVEHYEICGYGTARSYAEELGLKEVATLLEQTLNEEYYSDDKLTFLAESRINKQAEGNTRTGSSSLRGNGGRETARDTSKRREMEMEPVSSKRGTETKSTSASSAGPKASSSPRSTETRSKSSKSGASKTSAKSSRSSSGNGRSSASGRTRSR
jgi:ferritin-like metal-binding protein YciE